jgi:hypothetical protein
MKKTYIANLKFNLAHRQIWFMGEDNEEMNRKWKIACEQLGKIGDSCSETSDFFSAAINHFQSFGFVQVAK